MKRSQRSQAHQQQVLELRRSGATQWDKRPRGQRTRADVKRQAKKESEDS